MSPCRTDGNDPLTLAQRPVKRRMNTPPPRGARSSDPEYRLTKREGTRSSNFPSPTKEQMLHENRVYRETVEQVQNRAIAYANIRNEQFRDAAQRYSEYAKTSVISK